MVDGSGSGSQARPIETATAVFESAPDQKTRRYDRQLRLWASSGQAALEAAQVLVLSSSATCTALVKNLVLPGVGAFTLLDRAIVRARDAGNNFFLAGPASVGRPRAAEAVRLLLELNEGVRGEAIVDRTVAEVLDEGDNGNGEGEGEVKGVAWIKGFSLVVAHNLEAGVLERLAGILWADVRAPPLVVIRSAGFLAEVFIQFHEHAIIESHLESSPSLRIDKPFPALVEHVMALDFEGMDVTDHGHVPYVYILVRVLEDWKRAHGGHAPSTTAEKKEFKGLIQGMKKKFDEENFEEAESQAYRCWTETGVPSEIAALFSKTTPTSNASTTPPPPPPPHTRPFHTLLEALEIYTRTVPPHTLPLSATLPDMKASTTEYVALQRLYKARAVEEQEAFKHILVGVVARSGKGQGEIDDETVDNFVKNAHVLRLLRGKRWGWVDGDARALGEYAQSAPKQLAIHLALSALASLRAKHVAAAATAQSQQGQGQAALTADEEEEELEFQPSLEELRQEARAMLPGGVDLELLEEELENALGEAARSPTADLPNTAAFLGGVVAQEVIKMITKQYVPIDGYCVVDLVETWTGVMV